MGGRVLELETDRITQQGIRAWIQRGSKQTARKIVDVLLEDGRMPIEKIGKVTGVSLESIIKLDLERKGISDIKEGCVLEFDSSQLATQEFMQGFMHGYEKAFLQGFRQGKEEKACQIAKRLLEDGRLSAEEISEVTGLSLEKVTQLSPEDKKNF